jgi:hypothetical protein
MVSWFGPQKQAGFSLSVGMGHVSRSSGLLDVKASLARVSQSSLKTSGVAMMGGARGSITKIASEAY